MKDIRMISNTGYEVKQSFTINRKEIMLGENTDAKNEQYYLLCTFISGSLMSEYQNGVASDDYLELAEEYAKRVCIEIQELRTKNEKQDLHAQIFTASDCLPAGRSDDIHNKAVVKKNLFHGGEKHKERVQNARAERLKAVTLLPLILVKTFGVVLGRSFWHNISVFSWFTYEIRRTNSIYII